MLWTIAFVVLGTSFISGMIGMAGGLILMGALSFLMPVSSAMILHGVTQSHANGFRAFLLRKHIQWPVLLPYTLGGSLAFSLLSLIQLVPSKAFILVMIGLFPFLTLLITKFASFDIMTKCNGIVCGFLVVGGQLLAGASGPLLDMFFLKTSLNRYEVVATKSITQTLGHLIKVFYYGRLMILFEGSSLDISYWVFPIAVAMAFTGTALGKKVLERISEAHFLKYSRIVILLIGVVYVSKGVMLI